MNKNEIYNKFINAPLSVEKMKEYAVILSNDESFGNENFVQVGDKGNWYYEALVLTRRGYPKITDVIPKLFEWLQDMNWPGADEIWQLLSKLPRDVLIENFENAANKAINENDYSWMYWLYEFAIDNDIKPTDLHNKTLYIILKEKGL
jgi:hypothetical protein